jgi:putative ABC transport system permease protein
MNDDPIQPPGWVMRLLRWFCPDHLFEEIEGDLIQKFQRDVRTFGEVKARRRLVWSVVRFCRPGIVLRNRFSKNIINTIMLRSYLKISMRSLSAHKGNSFINVFGLVVGIAAALVILTIIRYELSFDRFHTDANRIFRVVTITDGDEDVLYTPGVAYPVPDALENEIPSVEKLTTVHYYRGLQVDVLDSKGLIKKKFQETDGCALVKPSFFEVFDFYGTRFKWIAGNPATALKDPFTVVLTRSMAEKYFATQDVLGRTLKLEQQLDFKITGVIEDLPPNTDFPFTVLFSYATFYMIQEHEMKNDWRSVANVNQCFMTLPAGVDKEEIERHIDRIYAAHVPEEVSKAMQFRLQPLREMHQDDRFGNFNLRTVDETMLWTLAFAGIVLLLIACINYINLATAQSTLRSKEIGIRKVLGGRRRQLILQFLSEAFIIALFASILAVVAAQLIIIQLEPLINISIDHFLFFDWFAIKALLVIVLIITLFAGFYPALMVSGFDPVDSIKNKLSAPGGGAHLRKSLVVVQFTVTQIFLIGTFVVLNQIEYFRNVDLGFEREGIIHVSLPNDYQSRINGLRNRLQAIPAVGEVSISSTAPSGLRRALWSTGIRRKEASSDQGTGCEYQAVDPNYLDLYGIKLVAGRNFSPDDSAGYLIINEALSLNVGFERSEEAIGRQMMLDGKDYTVIGVVNDFHSRSLKEGMDNVALAVHPHMYRLASIKFNISPRQANSSATLQSTIAGIESVWATTFPETAFDYRFMDENINAYYHHEIKISKLLQIFSVVLLTIGCLGLYGLMSFVVSRKLKEVAVRKVFGATMVHIMGLVSKDYLKLILLAFIIAVPVASYYLEQWLSTFVYRIGISWWIVLLPGVMAMLVALLAISGQLLKAARANPAETLKYE